MSDINNETLLETLYEEALSELTDSGLTLGAARRVAEKLAKTRFEKRAEADYSTNKYGTVDKDLPPDAFD